MFLCQTLNGSIANARSRRARPCSIWPARSSFVPSSPSARSDVRVERERFARRADAVGVPPVPDRRLRQLGVELGGPRVERATPRRAPARTAPGPAAATRSAPSSDHAAIDDESTASAARTAVARRVVRLRARDAAARARGAPARATGSPRGCGGAGRVAGPSPEKLATRLRPSSARASFGALRSTSSNEVFASGALYLSRNSSPARSRASRLRRVRGVRPRRTRRARCAPRSRCRATGAGTHARPRRGRSDDHPLAPRSYAAVERLRATRRVGVIAAPVGELRERHGGRAPARRLARDRVLERRVSRGEPAAQHERLAEQRGEVGAPPARAVAIASSSLPASTSARTARARVARPATRRGTPAARRGRRAR